MVNQGVSLAGPKEANWSKNAQLVCLFCTGEIAKPTKVMGGGRVSFCDSCTEKLENKGLLKRHQSGTIELIKPLLDVIGEF
ncbi:MAG: hypothetical protein AVW06_04470 [Hadesarchaea archaeon DG-33-1]|nr:MAG: hypothetical protein AVW06_04470 [Hadesarchaea archaeon DG-33-1]